MKLLFSLEEQERIMAAIRTGSDPWYSKEGDKMFDEFVKRAKEQVAAFIEQAEKTREEPPVWTGIPTL